MYTNCDSLLNKKAELEAKIASFDTKPSIIALTEILPKNYRYKVTAPELEIPGYQLFSNYAKQETHSIRGVALYIQNNIQVMEYQPKQHSDDSVWVRIRMQGNDTRFIGCVYRSPNSAPDMNNRLLNEIKEISNLRPTHLLLMGDFNFPKAEWSDSYCQLT